MCSVKNDAVSAEVDATQSHMKPVVVLETLDLARSVNSDSVSLCGKFATKFLKFLQ